MASRSSEIRRSDPLPFLSAYLKKQKSTKIEKRRWSIKAKMFSLIT